MAVPFWKTLLTLLFILVCIYVANGLDPDREYKEAEKNGKGNQLYNHRDLQE